MRVHPELHPDVRGSCYLGIPKADFVHGLKLANLYVKTRSVGNAALRPKGLALNWGPPQRGASGLGFVALTRDRRGSECIGLLEFRRSPNPRGRILNILLCHMSPTQRKSFKRGPHAEHRDRYKRGTRAGYFWTGEH